MCVYACMDDDVYVYLSVQSVCLSVCLLLSVCLFFVCIFACQWVCLSVTVRLCFFLSICLSVYLFVLLSFLAVCLPICLYVWVSVYVCLCVCGSVYLSPSDRLPGNVYRWTTLSVIPPDSLCFLQSLHDRETDYQTPNIGLRAECCSLKTGLYKCRQTRPKILTPTFLDPRAERSRVDLLSLSG